MLKNGKLINPEVRIETTNLCNTHCVMCPREKMTREQTIMPFEHFRDLVTQSKFLGAKMVSLFGYGEPLMDRSLPDKILFTTGHGLDTFITSNGMLLDWDTSFGLLSAGLKNIRFSLHAVHPVNYGKVHRQDWLTVMMNVGYFVKLNKKMGAHCKVHITAMPLNGESVAEICDTWGKYCDYLEVWKPHNWGGGRNYRAIHRKKKTCGRPFNGPVQIQVDGTVIPCCFLTNSEIVLGDTTQNSIEEILNNEQYQRLRRKHAEGDMIGLPCMDCDQLNNEVNSPLLYSNRDPDRRIGVTSTTKTDVEGD